MSPKLCAILVWREQGPFPRNLQDGKFTSERLNMMHMKSPENRAAGDRSRDQHP